MSGGFDDFDYLVVYSVSNTYAPEPPKPYFLEANSVYPHLPQVSRLLW